MDAGYFGAAPAVQPGPEGVWPGPWSLK